MDSVCSALSGNICSGSESERKGAGGTQCAWRNWVAGRPHRRAIWTSVEVSCIGQVIVAHKSPLAQAGPTGAWPGRVATSIATALGNLAPAAQKLAEMGDTLAVNSAVSWERSVKQGPRRHPPKATGARASPARRAEPGALRSQHN